MSETVKLLKGIMKTSGWTQEQVATKLGVSYPTMNAWVNGKSRPRQVMMDKIRRLYLAQDVTDDVEPTYVTLVNVSRGLKVGDMVMLEKDHSNSYDDEAIMAVILESDGDTDKWRDDVEILEEDVDKDGQIDDVDVLNCSEVDFMYVANSTSTVVRGTNSAGRIYDKFEKAARARVLFVFHKTAIARVVEWDYAEKGE